MNQLPLDTLNRCFAARHLGYFRTPEEAHKAYGVASAMLHGEFGRQQ